MSEQGNLAHAISHLREAEAKALIRQMMDEGVPATDILAQCHEGMADLGKRFERNECFIPELIFGGKIMEKVMGDLGPLLKDSSKPKGRSGSVVMGTVRNDVHNIGKDIVVMMLRGSGFDVIDLGVNVPPERFAQAVEDHDAMVIGMSVLLTTCYKAVPETVDAIKQAGLRDKVSIMLGGAAASSMLSEKTGCDFYGKTAVDAVSHASMVAESRGSN